MHSQSLWVLSGGGALCTLCAPDYQLKPSVDSVLTFERGRSLRTLTERRVDHSYITVALVGVGATRRCLRQWALPGACGLDLTSLSRSYRSLAFWLALSIHQILTLPVGPNLCASLRWPHRLIRLYFTRTIRRGAPRRTPYKLGTTLAHSFCCDNRSRRPKVFTALNLAVSFPSFSSRFFVAPICLWECVALALPPYFSLGTKMRTATALIHL